MYGRREFSDGKRSSEAGETTASDSVSVEEQVDALKMKLEQQYPTEREFLQAFEEVADTLTPIFQKDVKYLRIFEIMCEPERVVQFRVVWTDDLGNMQMNRGWRVQFNSALGPYKGGLRLAASVNTGVLKFLGFEQTFKNALTGLCMGGAKGGSDFDPKGKSDTEVRSFCRAFMTELWRHIGADTDVPAGDIGVGGREIGFLTGQWKKLTNSHTGATLTGKGADWGGSPLRPEATGYGAVYFAAEIFADVFDGGECPLRGKKCLVSGSGNAAQFTCEKLLELGAVVLSVSDTTGTLFFEHGMTSDELKLICKHKTQKREGLDKLGSEIGTFSSGAKPWNLAPGNVDIAFPCATQNEIDKGDAQALLTRQVKAVVEVANMPCTSEAIAVFKNDGVVYAPGKAANAGGVAVSGLEMAQNASKFQWTSSVVDNHLRNIMKNIYAAAKQNAVAFGYSPTDLQAGANIAAFVKVADAMYDQGLF